MQHDAGSQSESETVISQHFEPREDDNQTLYEVIEITGERVGQYRVRWKGRNPKTKKPWPQSWVLKQDCTDDLVFKWKRKMKGKEIKNNGRDSRASKRISHSVVSSASGKSCSTGPSNKSYELDAVLVQQQQRTIAVGPSNAISLTDPSPPSDAQFKPTKHKLAEAHLTNSSTNKRRFDIKPLEVGKDGARAASRKKRKIMTDIDGPPRNMPTQNHEKAALGAVKKRSKYDEVPAEGMIEHISPNVNNANDNSWNDAFEEKSQNVNARPAAPTKESKDYPDERVTLSPGAWQRLALFDIEVMGKEIHSVEKKQSKEMVGGLGEASILKCPKPLENNQPAISTLRSTLHFGDPSYLIEMELDDFQEPLSTTVEKGTVAKIDSSAANPSASKSLPHISHSTFHPHPRLPPNPSSKIVIEPLSLHEQPPEIDGIEQFELSEKECSNRLTKKKNGVVEMQRLGSKTDKGGCAGEVLALETVRRQEIFERAEAAKIQVSMSSMAVSTPTVKKAATQTQYCSASRLDDEGNKKLDNCVKDTSTDINPEVWRPDEESAQDTVAEQRQLQASMNLKETNDTTTPTPHTQGLDTRHLKLIFTNPTTCNVKDLRSMIDSHIADLRKHASLKTKNIVQITSLLNGEILVEMEDRYCMEKFMTAVQRMGIWSCETISLDYYRTASSASCVSWAWTEQHRRRFGCRRGGKKILKSDEADLVP